jgi:hypothetical protein
VFLRDPAAAGGLAFAHHDLRVFIAHNRGVTVWFPDASVSAATWHVKDRMLVRV